MSVFGVVGGPVWDEAAAEALLGAVVALRCELGEIRFSLLRAEERAQGQWAGGDRRAFDQRCEVIRRRFDGLQEQLDVIPGRVRDAGESVFRTQRMQAEMADAVWAQELAGAQELRR